MEIIAVREWGEKGPFGWSQRDGVRQKTYGKMGHLWRIFTEGIVFVAQRDLFQIILSNPCGPFRISLQFVLLSRRRVR